MFVIFILTLLFIFLFMFWFDRQWYRWFLLIDSFNNLSVGWWLLLNNKIYRWRFYQYHRIPLWWLIKGLFEYISIHWFLLCLLIHLDRLELGQFIPRGSSGYSKLMIVKFLLEEFDSLDIFSPFPKPRP